MSILAEDQVVRIARNAAAANNISIYTVSTAPAFTPDNRQTPYNNRLKVKNSQHHVVMLRGIGDATSSWRIVDFRFE